MNIFDCAPFQLRMKNERAPENEVSRQMVFCAENMVRNFRKKNETWSCFKKGLSELFHFRLKILR